MMPPQGAAGQGTPVRDHLEGRPRAGRLGGARRAARGAPAVRGEPRLRLRRGQPDPGCAPRPREGGQRPGRAPRGEARASAEAFPVWVEARADERLRALPSLPRAQCRASPRVRILLRGRRALRRSARRLRAGDEDGRGARGLRAPAGRARPAHRRGLRAGDRRLVPPPRALPGRSPAGAADRFILGRFGFREGTWRIDPVEHPFAASMATDGHPDDDPLAGARDRGVFAAMHEGGHALYEHNVEPDARAHATLPRHLARAARVAEPDVREPRRPQPRLVELGLPGGPAPVPRSSPTSSSTTSTGRSTRCSRR